MLASNFTKAMTAASATVICASQTPGAAGALTLATAGGVTLDTTRRVLITCAGNNSGVTFTITGTTHALRPISETIAGSNAGTSQTVNDFYMVTSVTISAASTGAVTVGTSTVGSSMWKNADTYRTPFALDIDVTLTGSATYSIETTNTDIQAQPTTSNTINVQPTSITNANASARMGLTMPCRYWRATILTGTGTLAVDSVQAGTF